MDNRYFEKRKDIDQFFVSENKISESRKIDISPSGNFQIETHRYSTGPNTWNYSRGLITRLSDNKVLADVKRNYGHFWHAWVQHKNGNEYLLCGEDYQGYSVLNLTNEKYHVYFPEEGFKGTGFCWAAAFPSPDGLVLTVDGCYWACPYELVFYDFREPEKLPYKEMARYGIIDDSSGWLDNETFILKKEIALRKSDGALYESLSDEEMEILDKDQSLVEYRYETTQFKRPPFQE